MLLAAIVLALTFLGGVGVTLSTQLACSARKKVKADAVPVTTSSTTNLMQVVHLTDWTVEGLKALWLHFELGPSTEPPEGGLGARAGRPHGEPQH